MQAGRIDLDADVNKYMVSWKIPDNEFIYDQKVTLRHLLSHTAGLTVSGLPGYAVGEPVPTLLEILDGRKPAKSAPVRVDTVPGTKWRYSGGGFLVVQQLLIDMTGKQFPVLMNELVLKKLSMGHSTFDQPLATALRRRAASGHKESGEKVKADWRTYPEMAPGGLWTTPSDLALFAIDLQRSRSRKRNKVLSAATATEMLSGQMKDFPIDAVSERYGREISNQGLGFRLEGKGRSAGFSHHGGNEGYQCFLVAYIESGQGVGVVMTNSDNAFELIQEIVRSIANEYRWPDYPLK